MGTPSERLLYQVAERPQRQMMRRSRDARWRSPNTWGPTGGLQGASRGLIRKLMDNNKMNFWKQ